MEQMIRAQTVHNCAACVWLMWNGYNIVYVKCNTTIWFMNANCWKCLCRRIFAVTLWKCVSRQFYDLCVNDFGRESEQIEMNDINRASYFMKSDKLAMFIVIDVSYLYHIHCSAQNWGQSVHTVRYMFVFLSKFTCFQLLCIRNIVCGKALVIISLDCSNSLQIKVFRQTIIIREVE